MILRGIMMTNTKLSTYVKYILRNRYFWSIIAFAFVFLSYKNAFAAADAEYRKFCLSDEFTNKYENADCWSCDVVLSLMQGVTKAAGILAGNVQALSKVILLYFGAIWIAVYFLKALGSFAQQDSTKLLDGLLNFMFRWCISYFLVYYGIEVIVEYMVNPLLSIGVDVGSAIAEKGM